MRLSTEERKAIVNTRIEKSILSLHEAKCNIEMGLWNAATNRLYYACYNMVSALLIKNGHMAQTHQGVAGLFALNYIKTGVVPKETGKTYSQILSLRQIADYDDWNIIEEGDITNIVEPVEKLIETVKALLKD